MYLFYLLMYLSVCLIIIYLILCCPRIIYMILHQVQFILFELQNCWTASHIDSNLIFGILDKVCQRPTFHFHLFKYMTNHEGQFQPSFCVCAGMHALGHVCGIVWFHLTLNQNLFLCMSKLNFTVTLSILPLFFYETVT